MPAASRTRWTREETQILVEHYPVGGLEAVSDRLPHRSAASIHMRASKLGISTSRRCRAPVPKLTGANLAAAVQLRERDGLTFEQIAKRFGICESAASNAILIELCKLRGYRPAERDELGLLTAEGIERIRYALKKGLKGVEIQLRLGVSAGCVAEQRRRYNAELKAAGKALLPPPGGGEAYCGAKVPKERRIEVENLFLQGFGTQKISERTGVSKTGCTRIRAKLVRRLKRQGQCLPGCDIDGRRHTHAESTRFVTQSQKEAFFELLMEGVPCSRAATLTAIGAVTAYRLRDQLAAELSEQGGTLPPAKRPGRVKDGAFRESYWPPNSPKEIYEFRATLAHLSFEEAKEQWRARMRQEQLDAAAKKAAAAMQPPSFAEQLAKVASGQLGITVAMPRYHLEPRYAA